MKRRYTILFFVALSPLIGLSWVASTSGSSVWSSRSLDLFGLILAAVVAGAAMIRGVRARWPAGVAAFVLLPMTINMARLVDQAFAFMRFLGWGLPLIVFGTLAAFATAIVVAVLPLPAPPREPQVTPARVVD